MYKAWFPALCMQHNARNTHNAKFYARNATYTRNGQWHGWNLSRDMACEKL